MTQHLQFVGHTTHSLAGLRVEDLVEADDRPKRQITLKKRRKNRNLGCGLYLVQIYNVHASAYGFGSSLSWPCGFLCNIGVRNTVFGTGLLVASIWHADPRAKPSCQKIVLLNIVYGT